ncbi:uncharacterized protein BDW70DRAFT_106334 [Aspergillus foveolatus]|uniref:uncharacterized protein n=1 Tax=Aspergillus foveolatus TaxID=210207 RepID=UPI003CCDB334
MEQARTEAAADWLRKDWTAVVLVDCWAWSASVSLRVMSVAHERTRLIYQNLQSPESQSPRKSSAPCSIQSPVQSSSSARHRYSHCHLSLDMLPGDCAGSQDTTDPESDQVCTALCAALEVGSDDICRWRPQSSSPINYWGLGTPSEHSSHYLSHCDWRSQKISGLVKPHIQPNIQNSVLFCTPCCRLACRSVQ